MTAGDTLPGANVARVSLEIDIDARMGFRHRILRTSRQRGRCGKFFFRMVRQPSFCILPRLAIPGKVHGGESVSVDELRTREQRRALVFLLAAAAVRRLRGPSARLAGDDRLAGLLRAYDCVGQPRKRMVLWRSLENDCLVVPPAGDVIPDIVAFPFRQPGHNRCQQINKKLKPFGHDSPAFLFVVVAGPGHQLGSQPVVGGVYVVSERTSFQLYADHRHGAAIAARRGR
mmetsp:Transcript_24952/g.58552  ORF Transcript_24952/g.58552 Transcript_24952/m.58552 type:complete len:230 (-) Transcript_24952:25-714(-)